MGLKFLGGKSWSEVTRDERFFCSRLHMLIEKNGVSDFVTFLNTKIGIDLDPTANWEIAFEACFYRDFLHHHEMPKANYSLKRTFDLCLFSDDAIVIIEAKAHGGFTELQMKDFDADQEQVKSLTGVKDVHLLALVSSRYNPKEDTKTRFNEWLRWKDLAENYGSDPILFRADDVFRS